MFPDSSPSVYIQDICLANRYTGKIFSDRLGFIFIEMLNFVKRSDELYTQLDKWLYALKHLSEFKRRPEYLNSPEFDDLFNLAKYSNLTKEERDMYNTSLKYKWDNKNVRDYEVNQGREMGLEEGLKIGVAKGEHKKAIAMALEMLADNISIDQIGRYAKLSIQEIMEL